MEADQVVSTLSAGHDGRVREFYETMFESQKRRRSITIHEFAVAEQKIRSGISLRAFAAKKFLAKEGYDPAHGARPLKRVIQKEILDPLSLEILDGKFQEGDRTIVDAVEDHLVFEKG